MTAVMATRLVSLPFERLAERYGSSINITFSQLMNLHGQARLAGSRRRLTMQTERFQISKSHSVKRPWIVEDTQTDPAEDPVIYHFKTKKMAEDFKALMVAEHCN